MQSDASTAPTWQRLKASATKPQPATGELFAADAGRSTRCTAAAAGLTLDFSRQRAGVGDLDNLARLADELGLRERIAGMYRGDIANPSEGRQVLHTALRRANAPYASEVHAEREHMLGFAEAVRSGAVRGSDGEQFELVVNIGIGGSDLGPAMAVEALRPYAGGAPRVVFVSNVDGSRLADTLATANPRRTLFIICSKTFTTQETRTNADSARRWLVEKLGAPAVPAHFAAVSTNAPAMDAFGVHPDYRFAMWDWVGGRYSIWSSIGVSLAIAIGAVQFREFLAGAAGMDEHFLAAPWLQNLPALMGLLGVWNIEFLHLPTLAVLPYDERLARFPRLPAAARHGEQRQARARRWFADLQRDFAGGVGRAWQQRAAFIFPDAAPGNPAGGVRLPAAGTFIKWRPAAHDLAIANCLAQAEAFAFGQQSDNPHKVHEGNRPSNLLLFRRLDPETLGALIALYEHKVFTQSVVWGINAFDQWGVELGKKLAAAIAPLVAGQGVAESVSLRAALEQLARLRG
ncbi:MAG: glucose-6-phosphate isomerase [Pseudomonadota bacterium]